MYIVRELITPRVFNIVTDALFERFTFSFEIQRIYLFLHAINEKVSCCDNLIDQNGSL